MLRRLPAPRTSGLAQQRERVIGKPEGNLQLGAVAQVETGGRMQQQVETQHQGNTCKPLRSLACLHNCGCGGYARVGSSRII